MYLSYILVDRLRANSVIFVISNMIGRERALAAKPEKSRVPLRGGQRNVNERQKRFLERNSTINNFDDNRTLAPKAKD